MTFADSPECTDRCRSTQHGDAVTAVLTRRNIPDEALCAYLAWLCYRCEEVRNSSGVTALHMASSCGHRGVVRWLAKCRRAQLDARDAENGHTALHRSAVYGKLDVLIELIKCGANPHLLDNDALTPCDHLIKYLPSELTNFHTNRFQFAYHSDGDLLSWGSNTNHQLGPQAARSIPEPFDFPHISDSDLVQKVCVGTFHTAILISSGRVFTCGHGRGGRLGQGNGQTVVIPKQVVCPDNQGAFFYAVAVGRDHTIFLTIDGVVYTCGLNTHHVLGLCSPVEEVLQPKPVGSFVKAKGVCAGRYHSAVWTDAALFVWGLNGGQLGIGKDVKKKYVELPHRVNLQSAKIATVVSGDAAMAVLTTTGTVYVLNQYLIRKIITNYSFIVSISIVGGQLGLDVENEVDKFGELRVAAVTNTGYILLWREQDPVLCRCFPSLNRDLHIKNVYLNEVEILLVTKSGEAYKALPLPRKKMALALNKKTDSVQCNVNLKMHRIPKVHRAISITSNMKGSDYFIITAPAIKSFDLPQVRKSSFDDDFASLLMEADESDNVHDVIIHAGGASFPVHRYIIARQAPHFTELLELDRPVINLMDTNPDIFKQFLRYVYTGTCDLFLNDLPPEKLKKKSEFLSQSWHEESLCESSHKKMAARYRRKKNFDADNSESDFEYNYTFRDDGTECCYKKLINSLKRLQKLAKRVGCYKLLGNLQVSKNTLKCTRHDSDIGNFRREDLPELYDTKIVCKNGKEIKAHKCVLAARSEYFKNMFLRWQGSETSAITLPFHDSVVKMLIDYLYTDLFAQLGSKDTDFISQVLILCDQLCEIRLKEACIYFLAVKITLKNCINLLLLADIYNSTNLKEICLTFVVDNIVSLLESNALDDLSDDVLKELTKRYCAERKQVSYRVITPYLQAPSEEEILAVSARYPVSLDQEVEKIKNPQKRRSRAHKSGTSVSFTESDSDKCKSPPPPTLVVNSEGEPVECENHSCEPETAGSMRVKAIVQAQEKIRDQNIETQFEKLGNNSSGSVDTSVPSPLGEDFPELTGRLSLSGCSPPKCRSKNEAKHKLSKISQKQRKRLLSESSNTVPSTPETPKNPWNTLPEVVPQQQSTSIQSDFVEIVSLQKKQKENLVKIQNKNLIHTQMEDKAIEELEKFYNKEDESDELITVERVDLDHDVALPVWVPHNK